MQPDAGPVSCLFFGRDDAEADLRDGLLKGPVFRPTYAYREALSGRKTLVIGRKGSGKSAICRHLANERSGGSAVDVPRHVLTASVHLGPHPIRRRIRGTGRGRWGADSG